MVPVLVGNFVRDITIFERYGLEIFNGFEFFFAASSTKSFVQSFNFGATGIAGFEKHKENVRETTLNDYRSKALL